MKNNGIIISLIIFALGLLLIAVTYFLNHVNAAALWFTVSALCFACLSGYLWRRRGKV